MCACSPQFAANQSLTNVVRAAIQQHRQIWVTEADFQLLANTGFNAVRLPVGYWVLADTQVTAAAEQSGALLERVAPAMNASLYSLSRSHGNSCHAELARRLNARHTGYQMIDSCCYSG